MMDKVCFTCGTQHEVKGVLDSLHLFTNIKAAHDAWRITYSRSGDAPVFTQISLEERDMVRDLVPSGAYLQQAIRRGDNLVGVIGQLDVYSEGSHL